MGKLPSTLGLKTTIVKRKNDHKSSCVNRSVVVETTSSNINMSAIMNPKEIDEKKVVVVRGENALELEVMKKELKSKDMLI